MAKTQKKEAKPPRKRKGIDEIDSLRAMNSRLAKHSELERDRMIWWFVMKYKTPNLTRLILREINRA